MKAIIDSNVFIAAWHKRDEHNEHAINILRQIAEGKIQEIFITNYVLLEVVNFLVRKAPFELAQEAWEYLTKTQRIRIVYIDVVMERELESFFLKYKALSLTDCSLIALADELNIKTVYSFDAGFDKVKEIERRENVT